MLAFIGAWNEFMFAMTFVLSSGKRTVPVGIAYLQGASQFELPWGSIMAASVVATLPIVIMVLVFQKRIVSGLTQGAVKG
jgi:ABC-type glycerol-3-phosphate transport system permease component